MQMTVDIFTAYFDITNQVEKKKQRNTCKGKISNISTYIYIPVTVFVPLLHHLNYGCAL